MGSRQVVKVCAAAVVAVTVQAWAPAGAAASTVLPACGAGTRFERTATASPGQAGARAGRIPGLGEVSASLDWDNRHQLTLAGAGFQVTRTYTPITRQVEIIIAGVDEVPVEIRLGGVDGFSITRGTQVVRGVSDPNAIRALVTGQGVAAFRELIGNYERRLIAGARSARFDDPHADGFLLAGALVGSLAGDPTAVGRARDLIMRRIRGPVHNAGVQFKDCVRDYEKYLLMIDGQRTSCLDAANGRDSWYARGADRLGCEVEFMAAAIAGEGQFISCTALGSILT